MRLRTGAVLGALMLAAAGCAGSAPVTSASPALTWPTPSPVASLMPTPMATPSPTPSASPSPSTRPTTVAVTFGPKGVGALALGMTKAQAKASTVVAGVTGTKGTCGLSGDGYLLGGSASDGNGDGKLWFSTQTNRLVMIAATSGLATPEGIAIGSSLAKVKKVYPSWKGDPDEDPNTGYVKVPGNGKAYYAISVDENSKRVNLMLLESADQDCAG